MLEIERKSGGEFEGDNVEIIETLLEETARYREMAISLVDSVEQVPEDVIENIRGSILLLRNALFFLICVKEFPEDLVRKVASEIKNTEDLLIKISE